MKAILLSNNIGDLKNVYSEQILEKLQAEAGLDPAYRTYADVCQAPSDYAEVKYIFTTWGFPTFSEEEIGRFFPSLEAVFYAAGSVQSFAAPFLKKGVKVFSAWAANAIPVAEYAAAQILLANKGFYSMARLNSQGDRASAKQLRKYYPGNYDVKIGLIGAGMVGKAVIRELKGHHLNICVFDPFLPDEAAAELGVTKCSLAELFANCFVISNHLANNEATKGMLNGALFETMLPYATFINTGRGAQVVEADLIRVLAERPDLTAILDVTYPEPPAEDSAFYQLENCILTPHIAGSIGNEVHRMAEYMREEFLRYQNGEACRYEVTLEMLKTMA